MAVIIYSKPGCPYCEKAREYYEENNVPYIDYDAQNDKQRQKEMFAFSGGDPTVPCIVEDGKYIQSGWGDPPRG
jgi:glutaredoxin